MSVKKMWLLRAKPHNYKISKIKEFMEMSIVGIGWPGLGDLTGKNYEEIKELLSTEYSKQKLGIYASTVNSFINDMAKGDLVVVPEEDIIHIAKIVGDYYYDEAFAGEEQGFPHQRRVEWLGEVSRHKLPMNFRNAFVQRTIANLSKFLDVIENILAGVDVDTGEVNTTKPDFSTYEYPVRPQLYAKISIPNDITEKEAERLASFVKTLYF